MSSILKYSLCKYETVVGEAVVRCDRPCQGEHCLEHQRLVDQIDDLEKEVDRIVRGRKK
jgi:hypothetical protein